MTFFSEISQSLARHLKGKVETSQSVVDVRPKTSKASTLIVRRTVKRIAVCNGTQQDGLYVLCWVT
jgi:hypothetical protein